MNAGNLPGSVTEGGGGSVLQAMLRDYLTHNKEVLFGEGCSFVKSRLIARLPAPPTIDAVMALACEADIDTCAVRLATMAGVFEKLLPPSAAESKDRDTAYQASLRLLLVLSESYVLSTEAGNQYLARRHEPVWTQDSLLSCVLAAARLGFGLSFKAGRRDPLNVIDAKPAASEFGNPGETGYGLVHAEALAALERLLKGETSPPPEPAAVPIGKPYFDARRGDLQDDIRDKLGADPVLRVEEVGDYAQEDKRQALQAGRSSDEAACYQQFAVHDCLNQVRARVREAENRLRRQELQINDEERREKAAERRRSIEERQQEQRQNLQSGEKPPPMRATERGNAQTRAQQAQQRAAEQQHRAAQQAQEQQERQQAEAQRASESRARYDAKQQKARERREQHERDKAQAQASGRKPPAPLPAP